MEVFLKVFLIFLFLGNHGQMPQVPTPHQFGILQQPITVKFRNRDCSLPTDTRLMLIGSGSTSDSKRVQLVIGYRWVFRCSGSDGFEVPRKIWEEAHTAYLTKMRR